MRYRLGDVFNVTLSDVPETKDALVTGTYTRPASQDQTTVAVGSEAFVWQVAGKLGRRRIEVGPVEEDEQSTWRAQEVSHRYT